MTRRTFIREVGPYKELHRDRRTGIAWVKDGSTGTGHSAHPNIDASGSVAGMKARGYWRKDDRAVRSHGFIYNVDRLSVSDALDEIAAAECLCVGCAERRAPA